MWRQCKGILYLGLCTTIFFHPYIKLYAANVQLTQLGVQLQQIQGSFPTPPEPTLSQPLQITQEPEKLTLERAQWKAHQNNPTLISRRLAQELNENAYQDAWETMYVPQITLSSNATSNYGLVKFPGSTAPSGSLEHGTPNSSVQVSVGDYRIYNFGKDKNTYDQARLTVDRSRQSLHEVERQVRFDVINKVFNLKTAQDILDALQRSVDISQAVYDLVKSRISLNKATPNDLASAEIDLLNAKNALIQSQLAYTQALWALNIVLGDPINYPYKVQTKISYSQFRMSLEEALRIYKENAPALKDAELGLEVSRLSLKNAKLNALPLPAISFTGITVGYNVGPQGTTLTRTSGPNGNFGISAGVNFSIPLSGSGGFLNQRSLRAAEISVEQSELNLRNIANTTEVSVRNTYTQIIQQQAVINNNEKLFKQASQVFEGALKALQSNTEINRLDFKNAIEQLRTAEQAFTNSTLQYYSLKLNLAQLIGVDRFPEEDL